MLKSKLKICRKSKCIIIALDIPENPIKDGLDEKIGSILKICRAQNIPVIHANSKKRLGMAFTGKIGPKITILSIISY